MQISNKFILALKAEKSNVDIHKHSAYQVVFTEDNPFLTTIENKKHNEIFGFAIKPQVAHSCECSQSNLIILNIEPYSFLGKFISTKLVQSNISIFSDKKEFQQFFESNKTEFSLTSLINDNYNQNIQPIDERVLKAISFINEQFKVENISTQAIAKQVYLSPSRLATVFKQQIGSNISKYLLWTRLRNAIFLILTEKDKSLTKIALESGFYDSSQMIKYMYQMFGILPSKLKQKSDLIQFLEIETH
jgi:AraC-like DNA-binding protein